MTWVKSMECGELLYGRRFPLKPKGAVYKSCVRPAIPYTSEAWCMKESEMGILRRTERSMVKAMLGVQPKDRKRSTDLMFMLGLNETIDQLAMANSDQWYGHVLRREEGHVLRRALDYEIEDQRKKGRPKMTWQRQVEQESMNVSLRRKEALCRSNWSVALTIIAAGLR